MAKGRGFRVDFLGEEHVHGLPRGDDHCGCRERLYVAGVPAWTTVSCGCHAEEELVVELRGDKPQHVLRSPGLHLQLEGAGSQGRAVVGGAGEAVEGVCVRDVRPAAGAQHLRDPTCQ
jgi:hypothetical protein